MDVYSVQRLYFFGVLCAFGSVLNRTDIYLMCPSNIWDPEETITLQCFVQKLSYPAKCVTQNAFKVIFVETDNVATEWCTLKDILGNCDSDGDCRCGTGNSSHYLFEYEFTPTKKHEGYWTCSVPCFNVFIPLTSSEHDCDNRKVHAPKPSTAPTDTESSSPSTLVIGLGVAGAVCVVMAAVGAGVYFRKQANQQTSASDCPDPLQYRDVFLLSLSGFTERKPGIITGLRQAGVPVTLLDFQATLTANERVTSVATMKDDCVVATDSRYITGLERKIVAWIQPSESDSLSVHFDRLVAFSRTSGQLITITTPRPPEQAMAQNARTMLEEIQGCTSYEEKEEKILQRAGSHITEEVTLAVDSVLQVYVLQNMGEEEEEIRHSIFFDLRQGFGTVERGERIVTARFAGIFTIRADDLPIILGTDVMQVMTLFTQGRIQAEVNNSAALLKFHEFAKKAFGL